MSLTDNYFQLYDLPQQYVLDENVLRATYRDLQRKTHPDKFADASKQEQRLAVQYAAVINDAYDVLSSPLKRAIYMLKLKGFELDAYQSVPMGGMFLMEQIELREELEQVMNGPDPEIVLDKISTQLERQLDTLQAEFLALIPQINGASTQDSPQMVVDGAIEVVKKMQFLVKIQAEVGHLEHELLDD